VCTLFIAVNIAGRYDSPQDDLRYAAFQTVSFVTTTGLSAADYTAWPAFSRLCLTALMLTGCCAGSTGGGIKLVRFLLVFKLLKIETDKIIHPKSVKAVNVNGKKVDEDVASKAAVFFFIYFIMLFVLAIPLTIESGDLAASVSAGVAALSNVGAGFGFMGRSGDFTGFSAFTKLFTALGMIAGRLEFIPLFVLFKAAVAKKAA
jgi:trk system potassium uptake protein TrkH